MEPVTLNPVGIVHSTYQNPAGLVDAWHPAAVEIFPAYTDALLRIKEHSHLWILSWFHQAGRDTLRTVPARVNPDSPEYGVFGMRCARRPNPIGLSLVWLEAVEGSLLRVRGLDALDGSPVLDVKPYFENDVVFTPKAPYIRPKDPAMLYKILYKRAYHHHQEECPDFLLALRIAMVAEKQFGLLNNPELKLEVQGSPCLADTLQGLFNARLAHPARFTYRESAVTLVRFWKGGQELTVIVKDRPSREELQDLTWSGFLESSVK